MNQSKKMEIELQFILNICHMDQHNEEIMKIVKL